MNDEIQQLIDINDRFSAIKYLEIINKKQMLQVACRLIFEDIEEDAFIAKVTSCTLSEIKELRDYVSVEGAMVELGIYEKSMRRYISRELPIVNGKIPRYLVRIFRYDRVYWSLLEWEYDTKKRKDQTEDDYIYHIRRCIAEYEKDFGGTFEEIYGHLTDIEIDLSDDAFNISKWKKLIEELKRTSKKVSD